MGAVSLIAVAIQFVTLFQCTPISYNWEGWKGDWKGKCLDINKLTYASAALNIAQDVAVLILPIPWLVKLQVNLKQKFGIMVMFSLGIL
jgi:hypothetical protein